MWHRGAALLTVVALSACASGSAEPAPTRPPPRAVDRTTAVDATTPCGHETTPPETYEHVVWIWMENKDTDDVLTSPQAPFINALAAACGVATNYRDHDIHPSLANYIVATSGDRQGITDNDEPAAHLLTVDNIFRQVRDEGGTAISYQDAMPGNCALTSTNDYAVKHNPAAYYVGGDDREACLRDDVPFARFAHDLAAGLPSLAFITPDLCHSMHDCDVSVGDAWLRDVVTKILDGTDYRSGSTVMFVMWDESEGGATMPFLAIAPSVVAGTRTDVPLDHYATLAFTERALGIDQRLGNAAHAPDLRMAFRL
jgi:hypothetical protein